jgi:hypothetical protein
LSQFQDAPLQPVSALVELSRIPHSAGKHIENGSLLFNLLKAIGKVKKSCFGINMPLKTSPGRDTNNCFKNDL